jgi:DNA-binding NtrC family response regulator
LFFRLNTFTIDLPPLRQRASDIPLLVKHILASVKTKMGLVDLRVTPEAMDLLRRFDWPGNVRQLENELERAAVVSDSEGLIDAKDLSDPVRGLGVDKSVIAAYRGKLRDIVEKVERELIEVTLAENDGNISRTAEMLGLTRKGLKDKKARYGIE